MRLRLKDIIGAPIESEREGRIISTVKALMIDPETGKVVALITSIFKQKIISPSDILRWGKVITVRDRDSIVLIDEILRVKEILMRVNPILGSRVETGKGVFLGKVFDYEVDTNAAELVTIFIAKSFLIFRYEAAQIPRRNIIKITPKKIIVKDRGVAEACVRRKGERARAVLPA